MTAQIPDRVLFKGEKYELIGYRGAALVHPEQFGMVPEEISTACYEGYYVTYKLGEGGFSLKEMTLREKSGRYLRIGGVEAKIDTYSATYKGLAVAVPFTGKIRIARGFIQDLYIHMGYQKASAYKCVLDISLERGKITEILDRSTEMEEKRGAFKKRCDEGNVFQLVEEAFSLDLDLE